MNYPIFDLRILEPAAQTKPKASKGGSVKD